MAGENTVTLVGNLTDDPELRYTPSGAAVANFTVAVNRYKGKDQESELEGFFKCSCWREMAEHVAELTKGARVIVVGRLKQRKWETKEGESRWEIEVQVDEVGPSLRWASAQVQRSNRDSGQRSGGGDFGGAQAQPAQAGGYQAPAQAQAPASGPAQTAPADDWGTTPVGGQMDEGGF